MDFVPLDDIKDDPDAIVARLKGLANADKDMLKSAHDNQAVADEDTYVSIWKRVIPRSRHGSPHGGRGSR
jgi:hypothetical protein